MIKLSFIEEKNWVILVFLSSLLIANQVISTSEIQVKILVQPEKCDRLSKMGDVLKVHYIGTFTDGEKFDSSYDRGEPITFQLGIGKVIPAWDQGLVGLCAGQKVKLMVPPHLAYFGPITENIPLNSVLIYEVDVISVEVGPKQVNIFEAIDLDGDKKLTRNEVTIFMRKQFDKAKAHGDIAADEDPNQESVIDEIFQHEDHDRDGIISFHEFSGSKKNHDEL